MNETPSPNPLPLPPDAIVTAIDPGWQRSALVSVRVGTGVIEDHRVEANADVRGILRTGELIRTEAYANRLADRLVIEQVEGMGMAVGREVFETVYWSGIFAEAFARWGPADRLTRHAVKLHLTGTRKAKDPEIRMALLDRYGPSRELAIGRKANPGPLYGIAGDEWAALAVAVTYIDRETGAAD